MESMDYWRLCDELSVVQAALLVAESDPAECGGYVEQQDQHNRPKGYEAAKTAFLNGLKREEITGQLVYVPETDINGYEIGLTNKVDLHQTTLSVSSVRSFLRKRGFNKGFFFPADVDARDFMDSRNPFYAPKLAAAVKAWEEVTSNHSLTKGKTPKQSLQKWLNEHASEYGLTDDEGNPTVAAIEDISKVANWKPEGGAARTPNLQQVAVNLPTPSKPKQKPKVQAPLDDEIPF